MTMSVGSSDGSFDDDTGHKRLGQLDREPWFEFRRHVSAAFTDPEHWAEHIDSYRLTGQSASQCLVPLLRASRTGLFPSR